MGLRSGKEEAWDMLGRTGAGGLGPPLAKGLNAQRYMQYPAQPGNSLSRKEKSETTKDDLLSYPPSPVHV